MIYLPTRGECKWYLKMLSLSAGNNSRSKNSEEMTISHWWLLMVIVFTGLILIVNSSAVNLSEIEYIYAKVHQIE